VQKWSDSHCFYRQPHDEGRHSSLIHPPWAEGRTEKGRLEFTPPDTVALP